MALTRRGVSLPARTIPVPSSISAEAQAMLSRMVGDDGVPANSLHVMPDASDHVGWMATKANVDRYYAAAVEAMAHGLKSRVELISIGDTDVHVAIPERLISDEHIYIELHGGALVFGGGAACRVGAQMQADLLGVRCYGVDYRMPPEHPFPAALDDCLATYRHALDRYPAANIIIGGRSAGGNLAAATVLRAHDEGLPLPGALVLLSPELDLSESGDSFHVNAMVDVVLPGSLMSTNLLYAGGADLCHPYLSPLFGEIGDGFPPTFLQSGTRDLFLSNTVRMHRKLRRAGVPTELHVFEGMPHGGFMGAPEDLELANEVALFVWMRWNLRAGERAEA